MSRSFLVILNKFKEYHTMLRNSMVSNISKTIADATAENKASFHYFNGSDLFESYCQYLVGARFVDSVHLFGQCITFVTQYLHFSNYYEEPKVFRNGNMIVQ